MRAQHTPGPWHHALSERFPEFYVTGPKGEHIATVAWSTVIQAANARLIEKAPEMAQLLALDAATFRHYERVFKEEGTADGQEKARRAAEFAAQCERLVAEATGSAA